jgi:hypothetical protein
MMPSRRGSRCGVGALTRECCLNEAAMHERPEAEPSSSCSMASTRSGRVVDDVEVHVHSKHPATHHIPNQYIDVFHSSSNALGRLGEPALFTHHLQGAAVHRWLRPAVRSSGPHWLVWHEYVIWYRGNVMYH